MPRTKTTLYPKVVPAYSPRPPYAEYKNPSKKPTENSVPYYISDIGRRPRSARDPIAWYDMGSRKRACLPGSHRAPGYKVDKGYPTHTTNCVRNCSAWSPARKTLKDGTCALKKKKKTARVAASPRPRASAKGGVRTPSAWLRVNKDIRNLFNYEGSSTPKDLTPVEWNRLLMKAAKVVYDSVLGGKGATIEDYSAASKTREYNDAIQYAVEGILEGQIV